MHGNRVLVTVVVASFCVLLQQPASAQTLYKSTMPDGRVVFGDTPAPGALRVEETEPDTSKGGLGVPTAREQEALQRMEKDRLERKAREDKMEAAEQALKNAEAARDTGKEPLEGERITFRVGGGVFRSRLTEAYFERQSKLEESVNNARREMERARTGK